MGYLKNQELLNAFGQNLRELRKKKDLSIKGLADYANLEYSQVARIERGKINTSISQANALAEALEVPLKRLFDFEIPDKRKKKKQ